MTLTSALLVSALLGAQPQGEVLDFSATWCGPCQQMSPVVSRLERQGYAIRKIDFDQNKALANKYGVTSLPTFLLIVNGKEVSRIEGMTSEGQLKRMLSQIPTAPVAKKKALSSGLRISMPSLKKRRSAPKSSEIRLVDDRKSKTSFQFPSLFSKKPEPRERTIDSPRPSGGSSYAKSSNSASHRRRQEMQQAEPALVRVSPTAASCRLLVKDNSGINFGSGTIVASQPGKTIILTCGHIFRNLKEDAEIQVDIFTKRSAKKYRGTVIRYDKEADVGLLSIASRETFPIARIARIGESASKSDLVISIGCNGGKDPTRQQLRVTALNRYLGPDNIECSGVPVQGRSGGGLFNREGHVIGVCIAADPKEKRGLYAGIKAIHQLLEESQLASLYRTKNETDPTLAKNDAHTTPRLEPTRNGQSKITSLEETSSAAHNPFGDSKPTDSLSLAEDRQQLMQAAMQEAGEADIICIVRPPQNSNKKSRVVIIHRASDKFKKYLSDERSPRASRTRSEQPDTRSLHNNHQHEDNSSSLNSREPATRSSISERRLIQTTAHETEPTNNGLQRYRRNRAIQ